MYWLDRYGQERDIYNYRLRKPGMTINPLSLNIWITNLQRRGPYKKRNYHWVRFIYLSRDMIRQKNEHSMDIYKSGVYTLLNTNSILIDAYNENQHKIDFEVYEIPEKYENPRNVNNGIEIREKESGSLSEYWVTAKYKNTYGVIDVRTPKMPILPFIYDKIDEQSFYLILYKDGLKCYYPISTTPRYIELSPFLNDDPFVRYKLPDGEEGWLLKSGEEFPDNKK